MFEKWLQFEFKTVWKDIAHESKDLMNKEPRLDLIKRGMRYCYASARTIFKYYSLMTKPFDEHIDCTELGSMSLNDWFTLLNDCELLLGNRSSVVHCGDTNNNKKMLKGSA